jgi:hypothetical protein
MNGKRSLPSNPTFDSYSFYLKLLSYILITIFLLFFNNKSYSAQVTLAWDPSNQSNLKGYKIYYGTVSGNYQWTIDAGNETSYMVTGLNTGATYYAAATAYNNSGLESSFSNEVTFTVSSIPGPPRATTKAASFHGRGAVSLNGYVNPNDLSTTYYFEWGITSAYGNATESQGITDGGGDLPVKAELNGLNPEAIYHFRLVAINSAGTAYGADQTFRASNASRDFNNDGNADILWRDVTTGDVAVWTMNGAGAISSISLIGQGIDTTNWEVVGTGDFNNDGNTDILWRDVTTGGVAVWTMNGAGAITSISLIGQGVDTTNWEVVGTGDFNNDGNTDILWRDVTTGQVAVWYMNGAGVISNTSMISQGIDTNWEIVGTGDFNNDGNMDILWRDKINGDVAVWYMNGAGVVSTISMIAQGVDTIWEIVGAGDFNNDGNTDILWRNKGNLEVAVWYMNGAGAVLSVSLIGQGVDTTNWIIVAP